MLVLDEAERIFDACFKKDMNAIISQQPRKRQTLLFSATQTKSVLDLARLGLKDPEYLSVQEEATTATPNCLQQTANIVPLHRQLDLLWSFIKAHMNSRILVFLIVALSCIFEDFKKLCPGIPLKCLHGKMNQERRLGTYVQSSEKRVFLFSTDVSANFNESVDWVVQKVRDMLKQEDKWDRIHACQLRKEKNFKQRMKWKRDRSEGDAEAASESDAEATSESDAEATSG